MAGAYASGVGGSAASGTSLVLTYTSTAGRVLVLGIQHPAGDIVSVVDTASNTWRFVNDSVAGNSAARLNDRDVSVWICNNPTPITSVTITTSASGVIVGSLLEFTGIDTGTPLRATASVVTTVASTTMATTPSAIPVFPGDVYVGFGGYTQTVAGTRIETPVGMASAAGAQANNGTSAIASAYGLVTTTTSSSFSWTLNTAKVTGGLAVVLKAPQAASAGTPGLAREFTPTSGPATPQAWAAQAPLATAWVPPGTPAAALAKVDAPTIVGQLWPRGKK